MAAVSRKAKDQQLESDILSIMPLGAGQEVGRSCHLLTFKDKKVMLDCGIHPGMKGLESLPYTDLVDLHDIDILLISHFHLDHAGALPWFLAKTQFKGRVFMTHATKAIYRMLLSDFVKVSNISSETMLYTDQDIEASMERIEAIDFHAETEVNGIKFWCYQAGHVLGAAMFMIEIAGVKTLYTGDFSRQEDRHLMAAEIPSVKPDVLIMEATYGTHIHEDREKREARFTSLITDIVKRGGRCLIPVFALGRAQELLLILDEYWAAHPELHDVPIYYASSLAKKCMSVYQTYINAMNSKIQKQITISNPFDFKHISYLKSIDHFEDLGPSVVMASPGMMQSGLSRELFEDWCVEKRNGTIIAGYCVEGTLAKKILSEPEEIETMSGQKLPLRCSVDYISFSAHTDYEQTSEFVRTLKPPHVVLVHGEHNEMMRLKAALIREYEENDETLQIYSPAIGESVPLHFRGEKMAKVVGSLAVKKPGHAQTLSGVLVKRNFAYHILSPSDISSYTELSTSTVMQRQSVAYTGSTSLLEFQLSQLAGDIETIKIDDKKFLKVFKDITVKIDPKMIVLEWESSPVNDMFADAVLAVIMRTEQEPEAKKKTNASLVKMDKSHFQECALDMLTEMFGEDCIGKLVKGDKVQLVVNDIQATVNINTCEVACEDATLKQIITTSVSKLQQSMMPVKSAVV
ncbi:cleavage and polyadenylation specificity factor subunit 3-like isoform X2 [Watersipora subatra]